MRIILPSILSRTATLALGVSAISLLAVQSAHAAIFNSVTPSVSGSSDGAASCTINNIMNVTGEPDHVGRTATQPDRARLRLLTNGGSVGLTTFRDGNFFAPNGTTSDVSLALTITNIADISGEISYEGYERDDHSNSGKMNGDVIFTRSNAITPAFLRSIPAGGGFCGEIADALEASNGGSNTAPVADAGSDQVSSVVPGATITLDGSGSSDADGDTLTYSWTQTSGPAVTLTGADTATPTFEAPATDAIFGFSLIVNDGSEASAADTVTITYSAPAANMVPVANAGVDQTVNAAAGTTITLDGTGSSDADGDMLGYSWTQTSGPAVTLTGADTAMPSFTASDAGADYTFSLVVNDGTVDSAADTVSISFNVANMSPVADAGEDQTLTLSPGSIISLDGTESSDPDGDSLTYSWTLTSGPAVSLNGADTATPSFVGPDEGGSYTFSLVVNDGTVDSALDSVTVTYSADAAPVAEAGQDIRVSGVVGTTVTLDASGSTDADSPTLSYAWTQIAGPAVVLEAADTATPSFEVPDVQTTQRLVFEVNVSDGTSSATDRVEVTVEPSGSVTLLVQTDGTDSTFTFASAQVAALSGSVTTVAGTASLISSELADGSYSVSLADARDDGFVLSSIVCSDTDSTGNVSDGTATLAVSPGEDLTCTFSLTNTREITSAAVRSMLVQRNTLLLANQPSLSRRTARLNGGSGSSGGVSVAGFTVPGSERLPLLASIGDDSASISASLAAMEGREAGKFDVWIEGVQSGFDLAGSEGDFGVLYAGVDMLASENTLIGVMAQHDTFESETASGDFVAEGDGFMVGPYATMKVGGVYFDGRAMWGQSDNEIAASGPERDDFETDRWLLAGSLSGQYRFQDKSTITPTFSVRHISEKQKDFADSFGVLIASQTVSHTEVSISPRFEKVFTTSEGGEFATFTTVEGIYSFGDDFEAVFANQLRARVEGGVSIRPTNGLVFNVSGFTDGLGADEFKNTGVRVSLGRSFN